MQTHAACSPAVQLAVQRASRFLTYFLNGAQNARLRAGRARFARESLPRHSSTCRASVDSWRSRWHELQGVA